ncbi:MAG: hypothetical protein H0Z34_12665 [Brevibacillus sp.]|nr:hypothetical protein [Brevibacillus sp.]
MDKRRYYVSVQAGTILENQGDAAYEFEIEATEDDVKTLRALFEERYENELDTFFRAHIPGVPYHFDTENDQYDESLRKIYSALYQLGTEETKNQIKSMGFA